MFFTKIVSIVVIFPYINPYVGLTLLKQSLFHGKWVVYGLHVPFFLNGQNTLQFPSYSHQIILSFYIHSTSHNPFFLSFEPFLH